MKACFRYPEGSRPPGNIEKPKISVPGLNLFRKVSDRELACIGYALMTNGLMPLDTEITED